MKTNADYKETQKYIKEYSKTTNKNLVELLKTIEAGSLKNRTDRNKIDAIKTLLL